MEGLRLGLMPFGEVIGNKLPQKSTLPVVLLIAFLLGIGVTFAEPAIGALKAAGANVDPKSAPYLYALLNTAGHVGFGGWRRGRVGGRAGHFAVHL